MSHKSETDISMQARADDTVTAMTPLNMTADDTSLTADTTMMTAVPPPGILKTYDQVVILMEISMRLFLALVS